MIWRTVKLGDLVDNFSFRAKNYGGSTNLNFLGVSNEDGITISKYAAEDKAEDYKIIEKGCFAYNPYRINVGSVALMNDEAKGLISPAYVVFKPKPKSIIPELLLKFLKSSEGLRQIKLYARGTVRQALRYEDLCKIEIRLPDYNEQNILFKNLNITHNEGDKLISEQTCQLNLLKKLRQQILQDAVQGKLVPEDPMDEPASKLLERINAEKEQLIREKKIMKDKPLPEIKHEEIPYEIPEKWEWCRLGDICGFITKGTTPSLDKIKTNGKIPYLKVYNIVGQKINFEYKPQFIDEGTHNDILTRSIVYPNDVLMNIVGPPLGKVAIVPNSFPQWNINQALVRFRPLDIEISSFLYFYLCEGSEIKKLIPLGVVGQDNLSLEQCRNLIFPLPPLSEQHRIVIQIDQLMKLCDELEHSIRQNQKYTQELLQVALKEALEPKK